MYSKILVPVDGSPWATLAAVRAAQLARQFRSQVTAFYVAQPLPGYVNTNDPRIEEVLQQINDRLEKNAAEILEQAKQEMLKHGVEPHTKFVWEHPADEICREAHEGRYDLIVMGSRGLGEIRGFLMGSVSNRVVRHAPCPVFIVR